MENCNGEPKLCKFAIYVNWFDFQEDSRNENIFTNIDLIVSVPTDTLATCDLFYCWRISLKIAA